ncbi:MAG: VWA domain-containing protein, partial [Gammaproteobacteria bacterium]|nr:VWA domain-containing protein [Gammaproteobacteria bacterium]
MILVGVFTVVFLIIAYWARYWMISAGKSNRQVSIVMFLLITVALVVMVYIEQMDRSFMLEDTPVMVAMTTDLSLSMGAAPDPREHGDVGTRLQRAQRILLPIMNALDSSGANVMVGITGFTAKSEMIMGWDGNLPQIREVIEYSLAPGILTQPGSDIGAALQGVLPLFENLPEEYQEQETRKYLIVISDGERTLERGEIETALEELRTNNIKIISLQVGSLDVPEGIPVFDDAGTFLGFQDIGGQIYTIPNTETMQLIAGDNPDDGVYIRAESINAVEDISQFLGIRMSALSTSGPMYT